MAPRESKVLKPLALCNVKLKAPSTLSSSREVVGCPIALERCPLQAQAADKSLSS